ncbi:MAG: RNA methyltransferase [Verrucomicrobia bacterium]|nr:RNA methyltransferase [Verrucomicrobiota bacterium]
MHIETIDGEPRFRNVPLSVIVHACHEKTVDAGLAALALPGLDRETLEPVLTYCAELRCEADAVTCPGCKRRTEAQGITTLDDFIAQHEEIIVGDGSVRLKGSGTGRLTTPALAALEKTWSGENYWFWARRVLRKLRHGIRRAHIRGNAIAPPGTTPSVILIEPQLPDNIGMVARACANFGLDDLRLVDPRDGWPNEKARIAASGANYVIDDAAAYDTFDAALSDLNWVCATTARQRDLRKPVLTPEEAVAEMRKRIAAGQRCGVIFGRERNGLE